MKAKILGAIVLIAVLLFVAYTFNQSNKQEQPSAESASKQAQNPQFILGNVSRTDSGMIYFDVGGSEKAAAVSAETFLIKQVKDKDGLKNVPAEFADFISGSAIVVYYASEPQGDTYQATKVQIIN
ncbi:MAG: hypothetical protein A3E98_04180 [Candidatus Doudnabacteria bacterium RIFCSPHIGHO2_12_FULL_48_11]|uniref:DUF5666 domain-containing protein n=1 Tax=Candidatus Doudnabacteria bacterium RIFCSPHIGHO2_01_FULL_46_24 TaxID=1817825 RepID=A0A1F5NVQ3_9BACT|nr:MAG: hypothetical protein A2720_00715 [Candidatus Doudnabacteria bacterium RIFCSPHIGHO2_01_FULL_46_24]OGE95991.1 MAG: hypothetical protein A3E98_04180 [Candidatus Doudnabacteria bacterium RIFCSPHIGHO2_12_FULL_48_11]